jgi:hypothetical protein
MPPSMQMERTSIEEVNADSAVPSEIVIPPGETAMLSTIQAE